ncbi:arrestin domain-containing protein 17 [Orussus abietinus]|uniref:arrestin domain-containing protein 17 n=1 Tax=Orussus abietinus TaxID=222816 RepID=UPI000626CC72|nr:arrestin domain-containing protein 17 [Orussus abietinus]XP_012282076.1 arrestin domain-containing protein 17 [Orussus abietinus]
MGLKDFKIVFDNPWNTYYGGQTVTGRIVVVLDSPKRIRNIHVKIVGQANTCWSSDKQEQNNEGRYENETQTVSAHEEYFSMKYYVVGSASDSEIDLPIGEHVYPFTCSLPVNIPSSFESHYGHIRYTVKAIMDRPWKFDHEVKTAFTVISMLNLNEEPGAAEPVQIELSKTFCCLCCGTAPLNVNVSLPVRGYVPGQSIPVKVNVENFSGVTVDSINLILRKIITFHANSPRSETKKDKIVVTQVSKGPVEGGGTADYVQNLDIPPVPPSNLKYCGIIDLVYNLKIEAHVSGWYHLNLKGSTLIYIGTVPLINYQTPIAPPIEDYPTKPTDYPPEQPVLPSAPPAPSTNLYPELPPPSYEESMYGAKSLRDRNESEHMLGIMSHFAPRYPVYKFTPPQ